MGNGISLFIACNICENIFWRSFSPITIKTDAGTEFEGSVIALVHSMFTNKVRITCKIYFRIKRLPCTTPSSARTPPIWITFSPLCWYSWWSFTSKDGRSSSQSEAWKWEAWKAPSPLSCSTPAPPRLYCRPPWSATFISSPRFFTRDLKITSSWN